MRTSLLLLKIIAKAALHTSGIGGLWTIVEDVPELANNVWNEWKAARNPAERRADLEAVAGLPDDLATDIERIVAEVAADQPASVRQDLAAYLAQVPASVRQTLRRPADPAGRTVPPALEPRSGDDLIPFLTARRPRFRAGDRPIPGADWVLVELLGIGGFGEVWKAKHFRSDDIKPVALKFCTEPEARKSLDREFELSLHLCGRLMEEGTHPGIVRLQETYLNAEPPCLRYEYVEGGTLGGLIKDWARREPRPSPEEITRHLLAIAKVMAFVHGLKPPIVHRDLKPANILVSGTSGSTRFKVADFGIGGIASAAVARANGRPNDPSLLLTRAVGGSHSPIYASAEQAAGGKADPRDDVHALGVIWYQMLTGNLAIGPTGGNAWRKKLADRGMSPALIQVLVSCLDEVDDRIANAGVLCQRIEQSLAASTGRPRSIRDGVAYVISAAMLSGVIYLVRTEDRIKIDPPSPPIAKVDPPAAPATTPALNKDVSPPDRPKRPVTPAPKPVKETLITNTLGMKLALIPAGEFAMGSDASDPDARADEKVNGKKHPVRISKPFFLGTTEVTVGQFRQFVERSNYKTEAERDGEGGYGWNEAKGHFERNPKYTWRSPGFPQTDDHPVVIVSGNDAVAFCEWLSQEEGQAYRLPTEAEWEYSCRTGRASRFSCGDDPEGLAAVGNVADGTAKAKLPSLDCIKANDGSVFTAPVAHFRPNEFGLFDMHGNVWEWCADWYDPNYYAKSPPADPLNSSDGSLRVIRGASWYDAAGCCRAAYRSWNTPSDSSNNLGLRLARVPSGP